MKNRVRPQAVAAMFAALSLASQGSAQIITTTDSFGSGSNAFTIDFVNIGNAGNAADTTGYGAVPYEYRIGTYEITQDAITKAIASGLSDVMAGPWTGDQPAAQMSWYEAAAFVNWMNTTSGYQAAYKVSFNSAQGAWNMTLWSSADAWSLGGTNLYRHKDAFYFLPSDNEWYKAAYFNAAGANYFLYPTASDTIPTAVGSGTNAGTAVYSQPLAQGPASVTNAGGLSPYGTMGQGGNVTEWTESAWDGTNNSGSESRMTRGDSYHGIGDPMRSTGAGATPVDGGGTSIGFRVASVPEPSTYALLLVTGAGALWWARRRR